ncbi:hypothetical protein LOAG_04527 [Loa loa]|uniref:Uncharacterized protein n=1 Tax=Loa loa TaxID=7209 RepID=A0A1S0U1T8_LOALO|nr:hypothetical protein LOAG_04527 [Loa loa]EFO23954.1 hypothetical protein LOAG_04527 [Loa loa]
MTFITTSRPSMLVPLPTLLFAAMKNEIFTTKEKTSLNQKCKEPLRHILSVIIDIFLLLSLLPELRVANITDHHRISSTPQQNSVPNSQNSVLEKFENAISPRNKRIRQQKHREF